MTITLFVKQIWQMIKDYKWIILITTIITTIIMMVLVIFISRQEQINTNIPIGEENYKKIGMIDIYMDESKENYYIEPVLLQDIINELAGWDSFIAHFSLHSSNPSVTDTQAIDNYFKDSSNPIESFLGIDPTQHNNIKIHPDTGNAYVTFEINPENGNMRLVNSDGGFNDFRIQLDVNADDGTFASGIPEDTDDLMNFKIGMTPNSSEQLGYIESVYNWNNGLNFPRMFENRANFYIKSPSKYSAPVLQTDSSSNSLLLPLIISIMVGLVAGFVLSFVLAVFSKDIKYGFTYTWNPEDLYLTYNFNDSDKQIVYDILQTKGYRIAILNEYRLSDVMVTKLDSVKTKDVESYKEISDIDIDDNFEEFVIVVQRYNTSKEWYRRQQRHLNAFRNKNVKIIEIPTI